jgi:hypothetical protein
MARRGPRKKAVASYGEENDQVLTDRIVKFRDLLVQRGGFTEEEAWVAISVRWVATVEDDQMRERVAIWLSEELDKLRESEKTVGAARVLKGEALSRLIIADMAIYMLEAGDPSHTKAN